MIRHMFICSCMFLISAGLLHGQPWKQLGGPHAGSGPPMKQEFMKELNLTDSQNEEFEKLVLAHRRKMIDTRAKLEQARLDMRELFTTAKPDRSAIEKALKATSDIQYRQRLDWTDHWFAVNAILTPDQQMIWKKHPNPMGRNRHGLGDRMRMHGRMGDKYDNEDEDKD